MMVLLEYAAVGLGGGLALIFLAKAVMAHLLQRENDYYRDEFDRGGEDDA